MTEKQRCDLTEIKNALEEHFEKNGRKIDGIGEVIKGLGYRLGDTYHLHGIGNNNRNEIQRVILVDGYEYNCTIGFVNYNYDVFSARVFTYLEDPDRNIFYKFENIRSR